MTRSKINPESEKETPNHQRSICEWLYGVFGIHFHEQSTAQKLSPFAVKKGNRKERKGINAKDTMEQQMHNKFFTTNNPPRYFA